MIVAFKKIKYIFNNDNLIYCGIKKDGTITVYSANGDNYEKPIPFILKK
ncbi:hypothetical protein [Clostridium thermobutyricum]|uniref:Uncharacterized protein n=1 Tax=Clostridium thermobutyricum DSM 4928 TaxID=1121339 RepID=A0A1V4SRV3_9CLOT|nr:hypothetical protein [Clostridium thermobutyricum]OPX46619.1 hypothetical protein CLTHE_28400 [Clostridium thermobutyricum DSM 4928]